MPAWSASGETLPGLQVPVFSLCTHRAEREKDLSSSSFETTNAIELGPTLMTSFNFNYLLKALSPNTVSLGLGLQHMNSREMQFSPCRRRMDRGGREGTVYTAHECNYRADMYT